MNYDDNFFNKVKNKTNVDKKTILDLAGELSNGNMKDENTIRKVIQTLSKITNKKVSKESEDKIVSTIIDGNVPKNVDKMF